jgi:hypothetical protein
MFVDKMNYSYLKSYKEGLSRDNFELKRLGITEETFLDRTCETFFHKIIFNYLVDKISSKLDNSARLVEKMKRLSKIEGNSLVLPIDEITDLINFSIYVEKSQNMKSKEDESSFKIPKMSQIVESGILSESKYVNDEKTFKIEDISKIIVEMSKNYTEDIIEESNQIVISFY